MRHALVVVALTLACGAARADVAPPRDEPESTWYGSMHQAESGREETYPMTLKLSADGGTTDYPKLNCGGELKLLGPASGGYMVYKETITRGAFDADKGTGCVDGVVITHIEGGNLVLGWFGAFDGEPVLASARLTRSQFNSR